MKDDKICPWNEDLHVLSLSCDENDRKLSIFIRNSSVVRAFVSPAQPEPGFDKNCTIVVQ